MLIDFFLRKRNFVVVVRGGLSFHSNHNHLLEIFKEEGKTSCTLINLSIMRKSSFDDERRSENVAMRRGGMKKLETRKGKRGKDYFKNKILTLIRAEMWKILISFETEKGVFKRFRLKIDPGTC